MSSSNKNKKSYRSLSPSNTKSNTSKKSTKHNSQQYQKEHQQQQQAKIKDQDKYFAIGFGSNFFHPFSKNAIPVVDIMLSSDGMEDDGTFSKPGGSNIKDSSVIAVNEIVDLDDITAHNANRTSHASSCSQCYEDDSSSNHQQHQCNDQLFTTHTNNYSDTTISIPNDAYVFPLRPDQDVSQQSAQIQKQILKRQQKQKKELFTSKKRTIFGAKQSPSYTRNTTSSITNTTNNNTTHSDTSSSPETLTSYLPYSTPINPLSSISIGGTHTTTLTKSGDIYLTGTLHGRTYPTPTIQISRLPLKCTQIACGKRHILALFEQKVIMTWGGGYFGQLGHGRDITFCHEPTIVERMLPQYRSGVGDIVRVVAGGMHSGAILSYTYSGDGNIIAQQQKEEKEMQDSSKTVEFVSTKTFLWGSNRYGQCAASGGKCNAIVYPTPMVDVLDPESNKNISFVHIEFGKTHTVGLTTKGQVYSWGSTASGRCGHGDCRNNPSSSAASKFQSSRSASPTKVGGGRYTTCLPKQIDALKHLKITQISVGDAHTLALSNDGKVYSWGCGSSGQTGHGHAMHLLSPRLVVDLDFRNEIRIALMKDDNTTATSTTTTCYSDHGRQDDIVVGNGNDGINLKTTTSCTVDALQSLKIDDCENDVLDETPVITSIHAAGSCSVALSSVGDLYTFGCGDGGQLGHVSTSQNSALPTVESGHIGTTQRIRDSISFDSRLNVLIPRRVDWLKKLGLKVQNVSLGQHFMIGICKNDIQNKCNTDSNYNINHENGKTLFELQNDQKERRFDRLRSYRKNHPTPCQINIQDGKDQKDSTTIDTLDAEKMKNASLDTSQQNLCSSKQSIDLKCTEKKTRTIFFGKAKKVFSSKSNK